MDLNCGMFKAHDIRTKSSELTAPVLERLSAALALYYREEVGVKSVVLCRDARLSAPHVMEAVMEALLSAGLDVIVNPLQLSTCHFYYMCMQLEESGGVMVTASHNPAEYIGLKLVSPGCSPIASGFGPAGGIGRIKELYLANRSLKSERRGRVHYLSLLEEYVDFSMELAGVEEGSLSSLNLFAEFLSGSAGGEFMHAFSKAGALVTPSHLIPDGFFPSGAPNPIIESSIHSAREKMKAGAFDLGFCFDGDGDRMDLMYWGGEQILPSLNMSILSPYLVRIFGKDGLKCLLDPKASPPAIIRVAKGGLEPHLVRNGHSFIKATLKEGLQDGFVAAVEESAHYYMTFPCKDGKLTASENTLFYALLTARALKEQSEAYEEIRRVESGIFRMREWTLSFKEPSLMEAVMDEVEEVMSARGGLIIKQLEDGRPLDSVLIRFGLPPIFTAETTLPSSWCQIAQRISRSEDALARWEVSASSAILVSEFDGAIRSVTDKYVKAGVAAY